MALTSPTSSWIVTLPGHTKTRALWLSAHFWATVSRRLTSPRTPVIVFMATLVLSVNMVLSATLLKELIGVTMEDVVGE